MFEHGFPKHWSTLKKLIWLKGAGIIGGISAVWKTVTGTLLHITDALASPMQKCEVTLEPIQDLHGQDAPYPAGGGGNLSGNEVNVYYPVHFNEDVVVTASADPPTSGTTQIYYYDENKTQIDCWGLSAGTRVQRTFTLPKEAYFIRWVSNGSTNFQLELGNTATPYAPYSNICPITGWTGCEVTRTGANLFDGEALATALSNYFEYSNGVISVKNSYYVGWTGQPIAGYLKPGTYTISATDPSSDSVVCEIRLGENAVTNKVARKSNNFKQTFTIEETTPYRFRVSSNVVGDSAKFQIEVGSDPTSFSIYDATTASATFPDSAGTVYGGTVDLVSGLLTVTHGKWNFPTDKNWSITTNAAQQSFSYLGLTGVKTVPSDTPNRTVVRTSWCKTNALKASETGWTATYTGTEPRFVVSYDNYLMINIGVPSPTSAQINQFIENNGLYLVYPLAEPLTYQLTPQEISTLKGVNNVWSNGDSIEITYKAQAI